MCTPPNPICAGNYGLTSCRVHGRVPKHPVRWKDVAVVHKEQLRDVKYEKGHGEGIAKVCYPHQLLACCPLCLLSPAEQQPGFHHVAHPRDSGHMLRGLHNHRWSHADHHQQARKAECIPTPDDRGDHALHD